MIFLRRLLLVAQVVLLCVGLVVAMIWNIFETVYVWFQMFCVKTNSLLSCGPVKSFAILWRVVNFWLGSVRKCSAFCKLYSHKICYLVTPTNHDVYDLIFVMIRDKTIFWFQMLKYLITTFPIHFAINNQHHCNTLFPSSTPCRPLTPRHSQGIYITEREPLRTF